MLAMKLLSEGYEVKAYGFWYGQKHNIELTKLKINIDNLQKLNLPISLQIINLCDVFNESNSSLNGVGEIPKADYNEADMKSTVVENRNVIFSSIIYGKALSWANMTKDNVKITLGIHGGDHELYPDCTEESYKAAEHLFKISNWGSEKVSYDAPFVNCTKAEVLNIGVQCMKDLGMNDDSINNILRYTHSCYDPDGYGRACGKCGTCKERLDAFAQNGLKDPVKYQK
jgi:7-cyano-7-deazaguanine synthase